MDAYTKFASSGEIFTILVETNCHDTICSVECFFYTIAVMDVDVDVEHAGMIPNALGSGLFEFSSKVRPD